MALNISNISNLFPSEKLNDLQSKRVAQSNSSEEQAMAVATKLGIKKNLRKRQQEGSGDLLNRRIAHIKAIQGVEPFQLSREQLDKKFQKLPQFEEWSSGFLQDLLDEESGDLVLSYVALKAMLESPQTALERKDKISKYLNAIEEHRSETLVSWVNTAKSVAGSLDDTDIAFKVQSMLSTASQSGLTTKQMTRSIIKTGGEDKGDAVIQAAMDALLVDLNTRPASTDVSEIYGSYSNLSKLGSVKSMFDSAGEELSELAVVYPDLECTKSDFLEVAFSLSEQSSRSNASAHTIGTLGLPLEGEYMVIAKVTNLLEKLPIQVWEQDEDRINEIGSMKKLMHDIARL